MNASRALLVLDGLFDDLDVETATAAADGWSVARWDRSDGQLREAEVVLHVLTKVDRALLGKMPRCRVVGRFGTGLDTVDQTATAERGIRVVGVRDYCIPELTAQTLGLAFALERRIEAVRDGRLRPDDSWQDVAARLPIPGRTKATIIGFGSIGRAVTRALLATGMSVRVVTRHGGADAAAAGAVPVTLDEGLGDAGMVLLHTSLGPGTVGLINGDRLAKMAPGAILINTARIGLIDEAAVAAALAEGRLGGVGLDARLAPNSPLRALLKDPRLLVTPHIGWYSGRSARALRQRTVRNAIAAAMEGEATRMRPEGGTG